MRARDEARDDRIRAEAERAVEHGHAGREPHRLRHVVVLAFAQIFHAQMAHVRVEEQLAVRRLEDERVVFRDEDARGVVRGAELVERVIFARDKRNDERFGGLLGKKVVCRIRVAAGCDDGSSV